MNKKGTEIVPQAVLAVMAVVLVSVCVYVFLSNHSAVNAKLTDSEFLNSLYIKQGKIDFYINQVMQNLTNESYTNHRLAQDFKTELSKYKKDGNYPIKEMVQIENQVSEPAFIYFEVNGKKTISIDFSFTLEEKIGESGKERMFASYSYKKKYERVFPVDVK